MLYKFSNGFSLLLWTNNFFLQENLQAQDVSETPTSTEPSTSACPVALVPSMQMPIDSYVSPETVLKAEIYWALHVCISHQSYRSNEHAGSLFKVMFSDSEIAKKFACGRQKVSYLLTFGLAPYFLNELYKKLKNSPNYVILFDESYNSISKWMSM